MVSAADRDTAAQTQVARWRDARLLAAAFLEDEPEVAGTIIKRRVDGQHRDEVKLFVAELARLGADLGQCWEKGNAPVLPVSALISAQLLGPDLRAVLHLAAMARDRDDTEQPG